MPVDELNRLLLRILKRAGLAEPGQTPSAEQWPDLLERLSRVLSDGEQDRYILDRSLSTMSKELEELTEQRTRFLLNTGYQLRNPLTVMLSTLQCAQKKSESTGSCLEIAEALALGGRRILRHMGMLLDFAQIDLGYLQLRQSRGDPGEIMKNLLKAASALSAYSSVRISPHGIDSLPEAWIDSGKLETVLGYLLSNSLHAAPSGSELEIRASFSGDTAADGGSITFEFLDRRPRLTDEELKGIKDRNGLSGEFNLALASELASLQGGSLDVRARNEGEGLALQFKLPFKSAASAIHSNQEAGAEVISKGDFDVRPEAAQEGVALGAPKTRDSSRASILYVEDNADVRAVVGRSLAQRYDLFVARDGESAWKLAEEHNPDLVICETKLEGKSGYELCQAIKSHPRLSTIPFLFLSADATLTSKIRALELGASDYLLKPFLESELLARIRSLLTQLKALKEARRNLVHAFGIQKALLPNSPSAFGRVELEALYEPVDGLSGDFYDVAPGKDWIYLYLADVTGHGLPSAQVTFLMKEIFQSEDLSSDPALPDLLQRLATRYSKSETGLDVALLLMRIHPEKRVFEFIRAGAPGPVYLEQNRATHLNLSAGPPLSKTSAPIGSYQVSELKLTEKSTLYFFSDGLTEFGTARRRITPREVLKALSKVSEASWADELPKILSEINGSPETDDDLTVVRLRLRD